MEIPGLWTPLIFLLILVVSGLGGFIVAKAEDDGLKEQLTKLKKEVAKLKEDNEDLKKGESILSSIIKSQDFRHTAKEKLIKEDGITITKLERQVRRQDIELAELRSLALSAEKLKIWREGCFKEFAKLPQINHSSDEEENLRKRLKEEKNARRDAELKLKNEQDKYNETKRHLRELSSGRTAKPTRKPAVAITPLPKRLTTTSASTQTTDDFPPTPKPAVVTTGACTQSDVVDFPATFQASTSTTTSSLTFPKAGTATHQTPQASVQDGTRSSAPPINPTGTSSSGEQIPCSCEPCVFLREKLQKELQKEMPLPTFMQMVWNKALKLKQQLETTEQACRDLHDGAAPKEAELKHHLETAEKAYRDLRDKAKIKEAELKQQLETAEQACKELRDSAGTKEAELTQLRTAVSELKRRVEQSEQALSEANERADSSASKAQITEAALAEALHDIGGALAEVQRFKQEKANAEEAYRALDSKVSEIGGLGQISTISQLKQTHAKQLKSAQDELQTQSEELQKVRSELFSANTQVNGLQGVIRRAQEDRHTAEEALANAEERNDWLEAELELARLPDIPDEPAPTEDDLFAQAANAASEPTPAPPHTTMAPPTSSVVPVTDEELTNDYST